MNKQYLCALINEIYGLAHVLCLLFEETENAELNVNPHAVASIARRIATNITEISQWLHDNNNGR
ncbi:MAG: hypothetical protein SWH68_11800 [Thermodesulfobacteriota bacterium]|nr:hypothetical protein [Thermodesulfobacteriota bacterium]